MILTPAQTRLVLTGKKTQLRLRVVEPRQVRRDNGTTYWTATFRTPSGMRANQPQVGMRLPLPVPSAGGEDDRRGVTITDVRHELLAAVDFAAARAEGHRTTDELKAWWITTHDVEWLRFTERLLAALAVADHDLGALADDLDVTELVLRRRLAALARITLPCGDDEEPRPAVVAHENGAWIRLEHAEHHAVLDRFACRWADVAVWAITFELDRETPARFLAPVGRGDAHGYTDNPAVALTDAGEAVDHGTQRVISEKSRLRDHARKVGVDDQLFQQFDDVEQRCQDLLRFANERGLDLRDQMRMAQRAMADIERKIRQQTDNARRAA